MEPKISIRAIFVCSISSKYLLEGGGSDGALLGGVFRCCSGNRLAEWLLAWRPDWTVGCIKRPRLDNQDKHQRTCRTNRQPAKSTLLFSTSPTTAAATSVTTTAATTTTSRATMEVAAVAAVFAVAFAAAVAAAKNSTGGFQEMRSLQKLRKIIASKVAARELVVL